MAFMIEHNHENNTIVTITISISIIIEEEEQVVVDEGTTEEDYKQTRYKYFSLSGEKRDKQTQPWAHSRRVCIVVSGLIKNNGSFHFFKPE
jgi:hypothetical protein